MKEFKSQNTGNTIIINCAPTGIVLRLKKVILSELTKYPLGFKLKENRNNIKELLNNEVDFVGIVEFIKNVIISIDTSEEFLDVIFECLQYCTYKKTYKINMDLFDDKSVPEAREDYYEIIFACVEENLRPFVKSLISLWKTHISTRQIDQLLGLM